MSNNEFDFEELDYGDLGDIDTSDFDLEQFERELGLLSDEPRNGETSGQDAKPKPDSTVAKADNSKNDDNNNTKHESDASSDEHLVAIEASKQESIAKANDGDKPVVEEASSTVTKKTDVQQASDKLATNDGKEQGKSNENSLDTKTEEAKAHGDKHTLRNQSTDTKTHKATGNTHGKRPGYQRSIGYQHLQMNPYMAATNMAMPGYLPFYSFAMPQMMMYPPQTGSRVYVNPKFAQSSQFASQELSAPPAGLSPELLRLREQIAATRRRKEAAKANAQGDGINISKASDSQTSSQVSTNGRKRNSGDDAIEVRSNKRPNTSSAPTNSATSHTPYQGIKIKGAATANRENTTNNTSMQTSSSGIHKQVNNDPAPTSSRITIKGRNAANREQAARLRKLGPDSVTTELKPSKDNEYLLLQNMGIGILCLLTNGKELERESFTQENATTWYQPNEGSDVQITLDGTFIPDDLSSSESVCTVTARPRVSLYDYLVGAGALTYTEPEDAVRVDSSSDADLTGAFQSYRDRVVSAAREYRVLSMAQWLALNFILLVSNSPRFTGNVETEILEIALKAVRKEQGLELVEDTDILWCQKLNQAARCSRDDAKEILAQWERDGNDSVSSRRYRDVYRELLKAYSDGYDTSQVNEDTYVKDTLVPILRTYFENSSLITTAGVIRGSRVRRQAVEPLSEGRKADFSVHSCDEDDSQVLLLVECKPPSTAGSDDLTTSMNEAIKAGADDLHVQVCGIVCHGHRCDVFAMDLQYHGMYRMKHLNTFFIPVDHTDFDVLLGVFQVMDTLQASA
ncbi:hypothetical protein VTP01DRAFT_9677 [Rhizomucor pusillus]|uniref:uncharacterized protein n=1 Tax=Rhizomucor pusillus TaxID=4840 RepID=UPI003744A09E